MSEDKEKIKKDLIKRIEKIPSFLALEEGYTPVIVIATKIETVRLKTKFYLTRNFLQIEKQIGKGQREQYFEHLGEYVKGLCQRKTKKI